MAVLHVCSNARALMWIRGTGKSLLPELSITYSKCKEEQRSPSRKSKEPSQVGDARYAAGAAYAAVLCLKLPASAARWSISPARINACPQVLGAKDSWHQGQATWMITSK